MKDIIAKLLAIVCLVPIAGVLGMCAWLVYAWGYTVAYDMLVVPIAAQYGYALPDISFGLWMCWMAVCSMIKLSVCPIKTPMKDQKQALSNIVSRLLTVISVIIICYILNWLVL
jgi:hypothetical protein